MTPSGKARLEADLKRLLQVERPAVIKAIEEARAHGDLSENAEYHAAKERQSFIQGRMADIRSKLATAEVIDPKTIKSDKVAFGATVTVEDEESGKKSTYQIVGVDESDIKKSKISYMSPLARSLLGKTEGTSIEHTTGKGIRYLKVITIKFI